VDEVLDGCLAGKDVLQMGNRIPDLGADVGAGRTMLAHTARPKNRS